MSHFHVSISAYTYELQASIGFLALSLLFLVVDVAGLWSGAPCSYLGMNSIVIYVGSEVLDSRFPFQAHMDTGYTSHAESMAGNIVGVMAWMVVARLMFQRKIFVNV